MVSAEQSVTGSPIPKNESWNQMSAAIPTGTARNDSPSPVEFSVAACVQEIVIDPEQVEVANCIEQEAEVSTVQIEPENSVCLPVQELITVEHDDTQVVVKPKRFPDNLSENLKIILGQNGKAYAIIQGAGNAYALAVGSKALNNCIRQLAMNEGIKLRRNDLSDINHHLQAEAEMAGVRRDVWHRVAQTEDGIVIDLGDDQHTHVRIMPGHVNVIRSGSNTLFSRSPVSKAMVLPVQVGNLRLLEKYINLQPVQRLLLVAWISYTLAHPKIPASKFVILVLQGNQGSGKSLLCRIIQQLIDPSIVGVQVLPSNPKDLSIASQNAHVLCYDNLRAISHSISDVLCTAATGGAITSRQLYSDADLNVIQLHVALVLNGIHSFIDQPDLAQRCLPLELLTISEGQRMSEVQFDREFQRDLPAIMGGLFDLIANILTHLPTVKVTNPERMLDFVRWLAAMEMADGAPAGTYQAGYSNLLNQGQLDTLQENLLASEVLDFARQLAGIDWSGTPAELLVGLTKQASPQTQRSREWPQNAIALSKRLKPLVAGLMTQGVHIDFTRGKERMITVKMEGVVDAYDDQF
jgi:hypothetical protein